MFGAGAMALSRRPKSLKSELGGVRGNPAGFVALFQPSIDH